MAKFDKDVEAYPGVYKFFRYSDDILILSYLPTADLELALPSMLPPGMIFNSSPQKSSQLSLACTKKDNQAIKSFEYLGYSYIMSDFCGDKDPRVVEVCIADRKILRLKTRIFKCFKAHQKDKNFVLLKERLQFISGNYVVQRHGVTAIKSSKYVKSGIYYNYRHCGVYSKGTCKEHRASELKALDGLYQSLIKPTSGFGSKLTAIQINELKEISFFKGFQLKITTRFKPDRIVLIKKVWRNG